MDELLKKKMIKYINLVFSVDILYKGLFIPFLSFGQKLLNVFLSSFPDTDVDLCKKKGAAK